MICTRASVILLNSTSKVALSDVGFGRKVTLLIVEPVSKVAETKSTLNVWTSVQPLASVIETV